MIDSISSVTTILSIKLWSAPKERQLFPLPIKPSTSIYICIVSKQVKYSVWKMQAISGSRTHTTLHILSETVWAYSIFHLIHLTADVPGHYFDCMCTLSGIVLAKGHIHESKTAFLNILNQTGVQICNSVEKKGERLPFHFLRAGSRHASSLPPPFSPALGFYLQLGCSTH